MSNASLKRAHRLATGLLLAASLGGWPGGLWLAIALTAAQTLHFAWRTGSARSLPVQVRAAYLALLLAGLWPPLALLHVLQLAGVAVLLATDHCLLVRLLVLAPWNRDAPWSLALARWVLAAPPAPRGRSPREFPNRCAAARPCPRRAPRPFRTGRGADSRSAPVRAHRCKPAGAPLPPGADTPADVAAHRDHSTGGKPNPALPAVRRPSSPRRSTGQPGPPMKTAQRSGCASGFVLHRRLRSAASCCAGVIGPQALNAASDTAAASRHSCCIVFIGFAFDGGCGSAITPQRPKPPRRASRIARADWRTRCQTFPRRQVRAAPASRRGPSRPDAPAASTGTDAAAGCRLGMVLFARASGSG
jgi:hypothetical protein